MVLQKRSKVDKNNGNVKIDLGCGFMCSIDLAFNDDRGDWDVIIRKFPLMADTCETVTGFFHTLEEAKACVERNKKMWATMGIAFLDENSVFHSSGNKFYEAAYKGAL